jgi:hypothetical protein
MGLADLKLSRLDFRPILCKLSIQELELSLEKHFKMKVRVEQLNLKLNLNCLWKRSGLQNASNTRDKKRTKFACNRLFFASMKELQIVVADSNLLFNADKFEQDFGNNLLMCFLRFLFKKTIFNASKIEIFIENLFKIISKRTKFACEQFVMSNANSSFFVFETYLCSNQEPINQSPSQYENTELIFKMFFDSLLFMCDEFKVYTLPSIHKHLAEFEYLSENLYQEFFSSENTKFQIALESLFGKKAQELSQSRLFIINTEITTLATLNLHFDNGYLNEIQQIFDCLIKKANLTIHFRFDFSYVNINCIGAKDAFPYAIRFFSNTEPIERIDLGVIGMLTANQALFNAKFEKVDFRNQLKNEFLAELNQIDLELESNRTNLNIYLNTFKPATLVLSELFDIYKFLSAFLKIIEDRTSESNKIGSFVICCIANLKGMSIEMPFLKQSSKETLVSVQSQQVIIKLKYQVVLEILIELKQNQLGQNSSSKNFKIKCEKCVFELMENKIEKKFQFVLSPLVLSDEFEFEQTKVQEERVQINRNLAKPSNHSFIYTYAVNSESNFSNEAYYKTSNEHHSNHGFRLSGRCLYMIALQIRYTGFQNASLVYSNQLEILLGDIFGSIDLNNFNELITFSENIFAFFYENFGISRSSFPYSSVRLKTSLTHIDLVIDQSILLNQSRDSLVLFKIVLAPIHYAFCDFHFKKPIHECSSCLPTLHLKVLLEKSKQSEEKMRKHVELLEHATIELNLLELFNSKWTEKDVKRIEFWKTCDEATKRLPFLWTKERSSCICFERSNFFFNSDSCDFKSEFVSKHFIYSFDANSNTNGFGESILVSKELAFFSSRKFLSEMFLTRAIEDIKLDNHFLKIQKFIVISHLEDDSELSKSKFELEEIDLYGQEINRFKCDNETRVKANKNELSRILQMAKVWPPFFSDEFSLYIKYLPIIRNLTHNTTQTLNGDFPYSDLLNNQLNSEAKKLYKFEKALKANQRNTSLNEYRFNINRFENGIILNKHSSIKESMCIFECFIQTSVGSFDSIQLVNDHSKINSNSNRMDVRSDEVQAQVRNGLIFMTSEGMPYVRKIFEAKTFLSTLRAVIRKTDMVLINHLRLILNPIDNSNETNRFADFDVVQVIIEKNAYLSVDICFLNVNVVNTGFVLSCCDFLLNLIRSQISAFKLQIRQIGLEGQTRKSLLDSPAAELSLTGNSSFFFALSDVKASKFTSFDKVFLFIDHIKRNLANISNNMQTSASSSKIVISNLTFKLRKNPKSNIKFRVWIKLIEIEIFDSSYRLNGSLRIEIFIQKSSVGTILVEFKKTIDIFEIAAKFTFEEQNNSVFGLDVSISGNGDSCSELKIDNEQLWLKSSLFKIQLEEKISDSFNETLDFENFCLNLNFIDKTMIVDSSKAFLQTKLKTVSESLIHNIGFMEYFLSSCSVFRKIEFKHHFFEMVLFPEKSKSFEQKTVLIRLNHLNITQLTHDSQVRSVQIRFKSEEKSGETSEILLLSDRIFQFDEQQFPNSKPFKRESISDRTQTVVKLPDCLLTLNFDNPSNQNVRYDYFVNGSSRFRINVSILDLVYKELCLKSYLKSKNENPNHAKLFNDKRKAHSDIKVVDLNEQIELNENNLTIFKSKYFFYSIHQLLFNQFFILKLLFQKAASTTKDTE